MVVAHRSTYYKSMVQVRQDQNLTTSLLTATTLAYTIGAGITAAAGTRLALQLFVVNDFALYSFQLPKPK